MKRYIFNLIAFLGLILFSCATGENYLSNFIQHHDGKSVKIAIIDTGLNAKLQNMYQSKIVYTYNTTNNSSIVDDQIGHGTSMITILSNEYSSLIPIYGISNRSDLIVVKVFDQLGHSNDSNLAEAVRIAVEQKADIINFSLGSYGNFPLTSYEIQVAFEQGILICAASGEYTNVLSFPANQPNVISVGQESTSHPINTDFLISFQDMKSIAIIDENIILKTENGSSVACIIFSGFCAGLISSRDKQSRKEVIANLIEELTYKNFNQLLLE